MGLARKQDSMACFAIVRDNFNIQTRLLVFVEGSSDPLVTALPKFQQLLNKYNNMFDDIGALLSHYITY